MVNIYCRSNGYCNKVTMFDYDYDREERMFESGYIKVENIDAAKIHIINNLCKLISISSIKIEKNNDDLIFIGEELEKFHASCLELYFDLL